MPRARSSPPTRRTTIAVFAPGANGNVAPEYTIAGSNTGLAGPDDVLVGFDGKLYVSNHSGSFNLVEVFNPRPRATRHRHRTSP